MTNVGLEGVDRMIGNKPGRSTTAPSENRENLAKKRFLLTDLHREMVPTQTVMHYSAALSNKSFKPNESGLKIKLIPGRLEKL